MNFRHIIFILVYFIVSLNISSSSDEVLADLDIKESQVELPPLSSNNILADDNTASINAGAAEIIQKDEIVHSVNQVGNEQTENIVNSDSVVAADETEKRVEEIVTDDESKRSSNTDINKSESIQENLTIPVFSEWTQQQMQEAEKKLVELTGNSTESNKEIKNDTLAKNQIVKKMMRQKNYASPDCGAKILANNPEAQSSASVLSDKDEYMLSPCTDRIWFVIELCDSIQANRVELANFELFSSPLKAVSISVSNRFPTRDWTSAGQYDAKSERDVQVFDLKDVTLFGKFVRVELEYTNTEHYCPLSFFRIFGTSEIEAFEVDNEQDNRNNHIPDDDDYISNQNKKIESSKDNILNRAGEAVLRIVQKAAEVLVKSNGNGAKQNDISSKQFQENCMTLSHDILCEICSNDERTTLSRIITCKSSALNSLLLESEVRDYLMNSVTCNNILGFDLKSDAIETNKNFIASILPEKYIAAMCNLVASDQNILPLKIEDLPDHITTISKKDEGGLKNISGDVQCKQTISNNSNNNNKNVESVPSNILQSDEEALKVVESTPKSEIEENVMEGSTTEKTLDDQNIFNKIERTQPYLEEPEEVTQPTIISTSENPLDVPATTEQPVEIKEPPKEEKPDSSKSQEHQPKVTEVKHQKVVTEPPQNNEVKADNNVENLKNVIMNSKDESRGSNAPESVFLRLSNRIKVLEKNMTLSTQYLEELSRRYKKQIEDLQQAYSKLQILYDSVSQNKKESEKKDAEEKRKLKENVDEISKKSDFLEIILIVLTSLFIVQVIFIIVLFKRLSILRDAFVMNECRTINENMVVSSNNSSIAENGNEKTTRTNGNGSKKKSKRVRKISAPNILSQRGTHASNGIKSNEFVVTHTTLNRTSSVPMKVNEMIEIKENLPQDSTMLEENDEFLLSSFADLKLNDVASSGNDNGPKNIEDYELYDTTSTASVKTEEEQHSSQCTNGNSGNFVRRLSSPTNFLKLKKSAMKVKNGRPPAMSLKKAKSESPPNFKSSSHNVSIQKSNSFEEDALKIRKNNSFKKLFKKLF